MCVSTNFVYVKGKGLTNASLQSLIILTDISSWPWALLILRALNIEKNVKKILSVTENSFWDMFN